MLFHNRKGFAGVKSHALAQSSCCRHNRRIGAQRLSLTAVKFGCGVAEQKRLNHLAVRRSLVLADLMKSNVADFNSDANKTKFNPTNFPADKIQVYYATDFEKASERIGELMAYVAAFTMITAPKPGFPLV